MQYYKNIEDNYITSIGTESGQFEITQEEYLNILSIIRNKPNAEEGTAYKLKADLTWESYEVEVISEDEMEISNEELGKMIKEVM